MMWSDPEDISEPWVISPRGAGYLFGSKVTKEFNHVRVFVGWAGPGFGAVFVFVFGEEGRGGGAVIAGHRRSPI